MYKLIHALFFIAILSSGLAQAQSDSGLLPPNTLSGNATGTRGAARPVSIGTSGATVPLLNGNNTYSGSATFQGSFSLTSLFNCMLGTNGAGLVGCISSGISGIYDVKSYGAACDGSTDDYSAIMNAISAAQAAGGGTVMFPGGKCATTQMIAISGAPDGYTKVTLKGQGQYASWLVGKGPSFTGACLVQFGGQGRVEGMSFNNGSQIGVTGVSMHGVCNNRPYGGGGVDHLTIENSLFFGFGLSGNNCVYNTGAQQATTSVFNSTFNYCWHGYKADTWDVGAVIQENHMFNVVQGIILDGTANAVEGVNILNNEILAGDPRSGATAFRPLDIVNACYDCHIAFNVFDAAPVGVGNYCTTSGLSRAVRIQGSATTSFVTNWMAKGFLANGSYNIGLRLTGNTFPDGCNAFIENATGFTASSNWAFAGSASGQWLSVVNSQNFSVTNNIAFGPTGGIAVGGTVANCTFGNNVVTGPSAMGAPCVSTGNVGP